MNYPKQTFASVFDAVASSPQEASNMQTRAQLAHQIVKTIRQMGWSQGASAHHCGITLPRMIDLLDGRISRFSLAALVKIQSRFSRP